MVNGSLLYLFYLNFKVKFSIFLAFMLADGNIYCGCYNIKKRNCLGKVEKNNLKSSEEKHKLIALLTVYKTGEPI